MEERVRVEERGKGRTFLVLADSDQYSDFAGKLVDSLAETSRVVSCRLPYLTDTNWREALHDLRQVIGDRSLRHFSIVGLGGASALAQFLGLVEHRAVRSLLLLDPSCRPHPTLLQRVVDRIEQSLPLGLPLRLHHEGFDSLPLLHRLRCPVLVALSTNASPFQKQQAELMARRLPTAWLTLLPPGDDAVSSLCSSAIDFQGVPVKCPQKRVSGEREMVSHGG